MPIADSRHDVLNGMGTLRCAVNNKVMDPGSPALAVVANPHLLDRRP